MCDRGEVVFNVKWVEAAVNFLMAFHPSESDVRIEGINMLPMIGCNIYEGI